MFEEAIFPFAYLVLQESIYMYIYWHIRPRLKSRCYNAFIKIFTTVAKNIPLIDAPTYQTFFLNLLVDKVSEKRTLDSIIATLKSLSPISCFIQLIRCKILCDKSTSRAMFSQSPEVWNSTKG